MIFLKIPLVLSVQQTSVNLNEPTKHISNTAIWQPNNLQNKLKFLSLCVCLSLALSLSLQDWPGLLVSVADRRAGERKGKKTSLAAHIHHLNNKATLINLPVQFSPTTPYGTGKIKYLSFSSLCWTPGNNLPWRSRSERGHHKALSLF